MINLSKDIDKIFSFEYDYNKDYILKGEFESDVFELEKEAEKLTKKKNKDNAKS